MGKNKKKAKKRSKLTDATPAAYEFELHPKGSLKLSDTDLSMKVDDKKAYEKELSKLETRLYELQVQMYLEKRKAILVFEGWDAAGKGGAIKRLTALMDPRGYKVWPIAAPKDAEIRHQYLWRFIMRLPDQGEIAIFDRSWYGRVLVERVEGFASTEAWNRAYDEINAFERMMTADGTLIAKFFLHIDKDTQLERFKERKEDPIKHFKIGPEDWRNRKKWGEYETAIQDMLDRTNRPDAPWFVIPANDKRYARLEVMRTCTELLKF
jgi:PPK2 family polyphosphate:nucleotide phosphotransferase